jgi:hypothetical protein
MSAPVATVRVRLVVEVKTSGAWGADCTIGQIQKQGVESATAIVQRQLGAAGIRIVGVSAVDMVVNCEEAP